MSELLPADPLVGQGLHRVEDERLLRGDGRYLEDQVFPGALQAVMLRAPLAHARMSRIDAGAARALPGVAAIFTGTDLVAGGIQPMPCLRPIVSVDGRPFFAPPRQAVAVETVRHVGEIVAVIVADSLTAAQDAADLVDIDYDPLPVVVDPRASQEIAFVWDKGDRAATDAAFRQAAHVVEATVVNNRILMSPIEPRAAVGLYDADSGGYTLHTQTQGVHLVRRLVATTLGVEPERLRVVTGDVGGSFGLKLVAFPEQTAVLFAARQLGRPVRWIGSRSETYLTDTAGRDHVSRAEIALDAEHRFLALRVETWGNLGAYASSVSPSSHTSGFAATLGGPYAIPLQHLRVNGVYTNTTPTDAYRGSGKPESIHLLERLIERAARTLGVDRVALRRRNLVPREAMPYQASSGVVYDCGDFAAVLDRALTLADWDGFAARRRRSEAEGRLRGLGLGLYVHVTGVTSQEVSEVLLLPSGTVEVRTGTQSTGQGHETTLAQLVAARLGIPPAQVRVSQGDTKGRPAGGGPTAGSSSLQVGGVTILRAAGRMLEQARAAAGTLLEVAAIDLAYERGAFTVVGTDRSVTLAGLAGALSARDAPGCAGSAELDGDITTIPNGAYVCEVEVDPDTGGVRLLRFCGVDDVGRRLNPTLVEGQLHGALAQGLGQAMMEATIFDPESGQLLSGSLMDYALPRAADLPCFELVAADLPTARNPLGMKGVAEVGCIGAPAAFMNAVADALGHDAIDMPATPESVWRALRGAGRGAV